MTATATVRSLLEEVHTEQSQVPDELVEWMSLHDIRWHLERIVALQPTSDAVESTAALKAVSDDQLEVIVDMCGEWHKGEGCWCVRELEASRSGAAGAAALQAARDRAAAPVTAERTLSYLVQLLRDPAYAEVSLERKLHQLAKLVITAFIQEQRAMESRSGRRPVQWGGSTAPAEVAWLPYASHEETRHHGPVDSGEWSFMVAELPEGVQLSGLRAATCSPATSGDGNACTDVAQASG